MSSAFSPAAQPSRKAFPKFLKDRPKKQRFVGIPVIEKSAKSPRNVRTPAPGEGRAS
jgi:hypothetical protein